MVLTQKTQHTYPYSWDVVTRAFWNKYPNPQLAHVERIDVLDRYIDANGCLRTARLAKCKQQNIPGWVKSVLGQSAYVYEETICDPVNKTLELKSRNMSYTSVATVEEQCHYRVDPVSPDATLYTQESKVTAFVPFISQNLESFSIKLGEAKAAIGLSVLEGLCGEIFDGTFSTAMCEPRGGAPSSQNTEFNSKVNS